MDSMVEIEKIFIEWAKENNLNLEEDDWGYINMDTAIARGAFISGFLKGKEHGSSRS